MLPGGQSPGDIGPEVHLHLLGGDVVVEDGLARVLHGVQLVLAGVPRRGGQLPLEQVSSSS